MNTKLKVRDLNKNSSQEEIKQARHNSTARLMAITIAKMEPGETTEWPLCPRLNNVLMSNVLPLILEEEGVKNVAVFALTTRNALSISRLSAE